MTAALSLFEPMPAVARKRASKVDPAPWLCRVVRERPLALNRARIASPGDVMRLVGPELALSPVEVFVMLALDSQSTVLAAIEVTRGILNSSLVHPREVFRAAIMAGAAGIIVVHNHPSGDPTPSGDDRAITRLLVEAGRILDLPVYDHVIIGNDRYTSLSEAGLL